NGIINFTSENGIKWIAIETGHHEKSLSYQVGTTETVLFKGNLGVLSIKQ
ncbi:MAG TPA: universal stress protein UspA, partial [Algoriphagus sp.]|nr:universal stress protein UspA [Algoriphagus sp.]